MTRREWSEIASLIRDELEGWRNGATAGYMEDRRDGADTALRILATRLATLLERHHARFDADTFLRECGLRD